MIETGSFLRGLKELGQQAESIFFGPETKGVVEQVRRDRNVEGCWHILVRTDEGNQQHFTEFEGMRVVTSENKTEFRFMDYWDAPQKGDEYCIRTRGTGVVLLPWSKIERDPFKLKE